jgi:hypothetical protein
MALRRASGGKREEEPQRYRKLNNEDRHNFYSSRYMERFAGHVALMRQTRIHTEF